MCEECFAQLWEHGRVDKWKPTSNPKFSLCCMMGKVVLPRAKKPPEILARLFKKQHPKSPNFLKHIRQYNNMFSFTSLGGKIDHSINNGGGPYVFRLNGENMHNIGSLLPVDGQAPKFAQLYIFDGDDEVTHQMTSAWYISILVVILY